MSLTNEKKQEIKKQYKDYKEEKEYEDSLFNADSDKNTLFFMGLFALACIIIYIQEVYF